MIIKGTQLTGEAGATDRLEDKIDRLAAEENPDPGRADRTL
jgi:hypothetical protein